MESTTRYESTSWKGRISDVLNPLISVGFSPDGKTFVSSSDDYTIRFWDVQTWEHIQTFAGHTDGVWGVVFSPDGNTLASTSRDTTVRLWDVQTGTILKTLKGHVRLVYTAVFSPDGNNLASGSRDGTLLFWDFTPDSAD